MSTNTLPARQNIGYTDCAEQQKLHETLELARGMLRCKYEHTACEPQHMLCTLCKTTSNTWFVWEPQLICNALWHGRHSCWHGAKARQVTAGIHACRLQPPTFVTSAYAQIFIDKCCIKLAFGTVWGFDWKQTKDLEESELDANSALSFRSQVSRYLANNTKLQQLSQATA